MAAISAGSRNGNQCESYGLLQVATTSRKTGGWVPVLHSRASVVTSPSTSSFLLLLPSAA